MHNIGQCSWASRTPLRIKGYGNLDNSIGNTDITCTSFTGSLTIFTATTTTTIIFTRFTIICTIFTCTTCTTYTITIRATSTSI